MCHNLVICGFYIPPSNSNYFGTHFDILDALSAYDETNPKIFIICGDLNSRVGSINQLNGYCYQENPDTAVNQHGRKLLDICKCNTLLPLNMLKKDESTEFRGGFTYSRGNLRSQNDWVIVSKHFIDHVIEFNFIDDLSNLSDHIPLQSKITIKVDKTFDQIIKSINDISSESNNHSHFKKYKLKDIDYEIFSNIMSTHFEDIKGNHIDLDPDTLANHIENSLQKSAKVAMVSTPRCRNNTEYENMPSENNLNETIRDDSRYEYNTWKSILSERDPKRIWEKIDFNGKFKTNVIKAENTCNEFADFLESRCSLPYQHINYDGINSNIFDPNLDSKMAADEILVTAKHMNKNSAARCGIPLGLLLAVIHPMLGILTILFNKVFTSTYPKSWVPFITCLPKKGKLNIPNVRGISLKQLLAKLYDGVISNRLKKWLTIPDEQTAYQKGKGCILHVFFIRTLIAACKTVRKPLFIGVTDFEAAFDHISRKYLFEKLVSLGIGMFLLRAIIEMYKVTDAYVLLDGEYSHNLSITAGVLQGAASSTILFIAYTQDIIKLFKTFFPIEELIHNFHILLHADDSLILATSKESLVKKFKKLEEYCIMNNIKLQLSKCCFLTINSDEKENIILERGEIENKSEFVYLGSTITDSGNINKDLKSEIEKKEKKLNKFFAFLTQNYNAPLEVKEKVLESCIISTVLYNCESWGNVNLENLEKKYRQALRYMLGVRKSTCNEFAYIELGKPTLKAEVQKRQLKFYLNCTRHKDLPMQRYIIRKALDLNCSFINYYVELSEKYKNPEDITNEFLTMLKNSIRGKANANHSRYQLYLEMNPTLQRPHIYNRYIPTQKLQLTTRLRMVSHELQVEKGRHQINPVPLMERLCSCGDIETESHFIMNCSHYTHIRNKYVELENLHFHERLDNLHTPNLICELLNCRKLYIKL